MDLNGQVEKRVVKVGTNAEGLVQLYLDSLVIEMTPSNFKHFVHYLQMALPMTEALEKAEGRPKLQLVPDPKDSPCERA